MRFYAVMYRTIVENKIVSIICSCLFFCLANIYRPGQGKVRLGRPHQTPPQGLNFYLRRKKITIPFYSELHALQCLVAQFSVLIFIYLKKKLLAKKPVKIFPIHHYWIII